MKYYCCDERRLEVLRRSGTANAIEFVEVLDLAAPPGVPRQQTLFVRLLRPGFALAPDNLRIDGGERVPSVGIVWTGPADALPPEAEAGLTDGLAETTRTLVIRTDSSGDHSLYRLAIVSNSGTTEPPAGFDPRLSAIEFSFKVECPSDFDCAEQRFCPLPRPHAPNIDYLAKDYAGFRRLMLDRLSLLAPEWTERSAADVGVTLVELLAFAADTLSYRQDAIANEAYLGTARQRVSVRRHARLVDYYLHEGCNARAFVQIQVNGQNRPLARGTMLLTRVSSLPMRIAAGTRELSDALADGAQVFEAARAATLHESLNRLSFYTWGDNGCCLPRGTTHAWLRGTAEGLAAGDFLVFQEVVSPTTFLAEDADRSHRHVVRLTRVTRTVDPSGRLFDEPPADAPLDITEIEWDSDDALPFPLCLGVVERPGLEVSVALGNIVLADHGRSTDEALVQVPAHVVRYAPVSAGVDCCEPLDRAVVPVRYRPVLTQSPLTHGFNLNALLDSPLSERDEWWSATALRALSAHDATPRIALIDSATSEPWEAQRDLLSSEPEAADFVVEVEDGGLARLRFGDDDHGRRPVAGARLDASYRVGNGAAGNVGAEAIAHIVTDVSGVYSSVINPLPASGGVEPEDVEAARRDAPQAFRTQERAVTPKDYAAAAERRPEVQRAAATFRWTGSWHTVFVTADRFGGGAVDARFEARLRTHLERFRMAGYDLEVDAPRYVPLRVELHLCVKPDYFRSEVLRAARDVLSNRMRPDGTLGLFHPDNFSFGQPVYLSRIVQTAQAVEGVESVRVDRFERLMGPSPTSLADGVITVGRLEIAQLENNPNFRERGTLKLTAGGGK